MASKTIQNVQLNANGSLQVNYSDGSGSTFPDREALTTDPRVADVGSDDWLVGLLLSRWLALDPDLNDPAEINGVTCEVNLSSVLNPVSFG